MERILFPTDGSDTARKALEFAIHMDKGARAKIIVLTVAEALPQGIAEQQSELKKHLERRAEAIAKEATMKVAKQGLEAETIVAIGDPSETIIRLAKAEKVDAIVMGTRGVVPCSSIGVGWSYTSSSGLIGSFQLLPQYDGMTNVGLTLLFLSVNCPHPNGI